MGGFTAHGKDRLLCAAQGTRRWSQYERVKERWVSRKTNPLRTVTANGVAIMSPQRVGGQWTAVVPTVALVSLQQPWAAPSVSFSMGRATVGYLYFICLINLV